eukprot:3591396-Amphidinium_carterae.1
MDTSNFPSSCIEVMSTTFPDALHVHVAKAGSPRPVTSPEHTATLFPRANFQKADILKKPGTAFKA